MRIKCVFKTLAISLVSVVALFVITVQSAKAEFDHYYGKYTIKLGFVTLATMEIAAKETDSRYNLIGLIQTSGLVKLIQPFKYKVYVGGVLNERNYRPISYFERSRRRNTNRTQRMKLDNGIPVVNVFNPPASRIRPIPESQVRGSIDPVTALHKLLRTAPLRQQCQYSHFVYDGKKLGHIGLKFRKITRSKVTCDGVYERVSGFSAEDLKENKAFKFTVTLLPVNPNSKKHIRDQVFYTASIKTQSVFGGVNIKPVGIPNYK